MSMVEYPKLTIKTLFGLTGRGKKPCQKLCGNSVQALVENAIELQHDAGAAKQLFELKEFSEGKNITTLASAGRDDLDIRGF